MLRTYSTNITATANEAIVFNINKLNTDASIRHNNTSPNIVVQSPGYYRVDFDISATITAASTDPITIQLYANGTPIPDAIINQTFTQDAYSDLSFTTSIRANPGIMGQNAVLTIVPSADLTIANVAVGVDKIVA